MTQKRCATRLNVVDLTHLIPRVESCGRHISTADSLDLLD